jgi:hypothetical protein
MSYSEAWMKQISEKRKVKQEFVLRETPRIMERDGISLASAVAKAGKLHDKIVVEEFNQHNKRLQDAYEQEY